MSGYGDGFFDVPSGYRDADLEMAALVNAGNRAAKRYRGFSPEERAALEAGAIVSATRYFGPADDRRSYVALVRSVDRDEIGPLLEWSLTGRSDDWHDSCRAARLAYSAASGATVGERVGAHV